MTRASTPLAMPTNAVPEARGTMPSALLASQLGVDRKGLIDTLKKTVMPGGVSDEDVFAFCLVAYTYKLNPLTREIFAYPRKGGGIQPVVSVDGWIKVVNSQSNLDGIDFEDEDDEQGRPVSKTGVIYIKGRSHPVRVKERYVECKRSTDPWNQMPHRMLRHKALIQTARVAFGISGLYDEDEARDFVDVDAVSVPTPARSKTADLNAKLATAKPAKQLPQPEPVEFEPALQANDHDDIPFGNAEDDIEAARREAGGQDQAPTDNLAPTPETLPADTNEAQFVGWASTFAPDSWDPDAAVLHVQTQMKVLSSKAFGKLNATEKQALYDKVRKGSWVKR